MKNKKKFSEFMAGMGEVFDKEITRTVSQVYWGALAPFSDEQCDQAFNMALATCKFFPKPADLLEIIRGREQDKAVEAWMIVDRAMREHGTYASLNFGDPKILACIESLGGWEYLGTLDEREWAYKRKEFESMYRARTSVGAPDHIAGIHEKNNLLRGFEEPGKVISIQRKTQKLLA